MESLDTSTSQTKEVSKIQADTDQVLVCVTSTRWDTNNVQIVYKLNTVAN